MKEDPKPGQQFEFRAGITSPVGVFPGWGGMMPDLDPGSLPPNRPALALNCRYESGQIRTRLGLELLTIVPPAWEVTAGPDPSLFAESVVWMGSHHMQARAPLLWLLTFSPGVCQVSTYNPDEAAVKSIAALATSIQVPNGIAAFGGDVYVASEMNLWKLNPSRGSTSLIARVDSVANLQEFGGRLWVGTAQTWDGVSLSTLAGSINITSSCIWRDSYLVGAAYGGAAYVYGDYTGVMVTAALPGTVTNPYKNAVVEFREAVYVASGGRDIYKVIPSVSAVVAHTLPVDSKVMALAVLGDFLFYLYTTDDGNSSTNYLGIHDPDGLNIQWVDQHKVLTELTGEVRSMVVYRNRLYVGTADAFGTHTLSCDATTAWYGIAGSANAGLLVA